MCDSKVRKIQMKAESKLLSKEVLRKRQLYKKKTDLEKGKSLLLLKIDEAVDQSRDLRKYEQIYVFFFLEL